MLPGCWHYTLDLPLRSKVTPIYRHSSLLDLSHLRVVTVERVIDHAPCRRLASQLLSLSLGQ